MEAKTETNMKNHSAAAQFILWVGYLFVLTSNWLRVVLAQSDYNQLNRKTSGIEAFISGATLIIAVGVFFGITMGMILS